MTHHYGSKDALRLAVDEYVVGLYREALQEIPESTGPNDVAAVRDANVARMLLSNPPVQKYLRRAYLEPDDGQPGVLEQLTDLTLAEVRQLRADRIASTRRSETDQAMQVVIRQLGELLMQPLVDRVWAHLDGERDARPTVRLHVESAAEDGPHR